MASILEKNVNTGVQNQTSEKKYFKVIQVFFDDEAESSHCLYLKPHKLKNEKNPSRPQGRTLFVNNVPSYCTEASMKRLFMKFGKVEKVELCPGPGQESFENKKSKFFDADNKIRGFGCAYIVFKEATGLQSVMDAQISSRLNLSHPGNPIPVGLEAMMAQYNKSVQIDYSRVQTEIEEFMQKFDQKELEAEEQARETQDKPDEEGWTVVSKQRGAPRTEARQIQSSQRARRKQKQMELINFYSFQMRETKRDQLAELRKKFEADKQRIALMRAQRKFKPY